MKVAVTYDNGQVFQYFGHTECFKLYEVENGTVVSEMFLEPNGSGHGALAGFLQVYGVEVLICVTIYGDYHEGLSDRIFRDLGIAPELQNWEGSR